MSALDELIANAKTANKGLLPHYKWQNNNTGINLAYNMTSQQVTEAAERDLAALRERVEALEWVVKRLEYIEEYPAEEMLCPICRGEKPTHYVDCELATALQAP